MSKKQRGRTAPNDCKDLHNKIICALTHDISVCDRCKQCKGKDSAEIRVNLIKEFAEEVGMDLPWLENKDEN